jgi:hypothetical protein
VNLIEFDAARSFAHASYYVQKTFNENPPDVNLATTVDLRPKPDPNRPLMAGRFGLGSWHTASEFKELRVYDAQGKLVFSDDFQDLSHWETPGVGRWQAASGVLRQTDLGASPSMLLLKTPELKTGRVTLKARRADGNEGFLIYFNASGIDRFLFCNYGAAGNNFSAIQERGAPEGCTFQGGRSMPGPIDKGRWYEISLVVGRDKAEMFLDGKLRFAEVARTRLQLPRRRHRAGANAESAGPPWIEVVLLRSAPGRSPSHETDRDLP